MNKNRQIISELKDFFKQNHGRPENLGVNGVVIGALTCDGSVDLAAMKRLIEEAQG